MNFFFIVLLLHSINFSFSKGGNEDSIKTSDKITQKGNENSLPDLNIQLPDNEDWIFDGRDTNGTSKNNNVQIMNSLIGETSNEVLRATKKGKEKDQNTNLPDLNISLLESEEEFWDYGETSATSKNNSYNMRNPIDSDIIDNSGNNIKKPPYKKKKKTLKGTSQNETGGYGEAPFFYLLSRLCYEIRIARKKIKLIDFGDKIYGNDKTEFRKKFGIKGKCARNRQYYTIDNYLSKKRTSKEKNCLKNITEKMAIENILYWEEIVKTHPDFEELKETGDILFESLSNGNSLGEATIFYLLSRLCYEIRIARRKIKFIEFGNKIYGNNTTEFRKKFGIAKKFPKKRQYYNIVHYFKQKMSFSVKNCLENITEKMAIENILYWRGIVETHPDFEELKKFGDFLLTTSDRKIPFDI